ncbi:AMP-dependent synthetase/ligase [Streptomyces boninensis]|uniref:AMP-dependent synthetase/ligase n=1 Tax=Streptomyces boninensis TaxID=2039455 RepID=UPI003B21CA2A
MTTILRLPDPLTIPALLARNAEDHPGLPALSWRAPDDTWTTLTWSEARTRIDHLAAGFAVHGIGRGDHVLLMMGNIPEHWLCDLALVQLGAVPVSVYGTSAPEQVAYIARHSRARLAVVEGAAQASRFEPAFADTGSGLEKLLNVEQGGYAALLEIGRRTYADTADAIDKAWRQTTPADPLTVVYTSGTTGDPKGVVVSHHNVLRNAVSLDGVTDLPDHVEHVCYLPFAHIAERMLGIYLPVFRAAHVRLCTDPTAVAATVRELHPAEFFGVPRVWEKLAASIRAGLALLPEPQREALAAAGGTARSYVTCKERGEEPPGELAAAYAKARAEVIEPLLALAGFEQLVWTASASAPMPRDVVDFFAGFGIVINDAWGLTETVGVATTNSPSGFRLGSVGRAIEGVEIRIAADGEIEVRGETVFAGYLQADGSVAAAVDADGWFATGDIGRLDDDGFLWLTDRKKEMIVTSTGKNVSPALVENTLKEHPLIGQAFVHGDGRSYLVALIVPDPEATAAWAAAEGIEGDFAAVTAHPRLREEVARAVAAANTHLNSTEQVKRHALLDREWSPDTGELTPSLKLRRRVVRELHGERIKALYRD